MRSWCSSDHSTSAPIARSTSIITSRSATGYRLWSVLTPGARSAAAICLVPEFLVAPETRAVPCSGAPARTTKQSFTAGSFREAQRQILFELRMPGDPPDGNGRHDARKVLLAERNDREVFAKRSDDFLAGKDLARTGMVTQSRREIDRHPNEVVALEHDDLPRRHPDTQRKDDVGSLELLSEVEHGLDHGAHLGADEHATVAQPLADPDAVIRREPPHDGSKCPEHGKCFVVAQSVVHPRESAHVDEREAAEDPHPDSVTDRRPARANRRQSGVRKAQPSRAHERTAASH